MLRNPNCARSGGGGLRASCDYLCTLTSISSWVVLPQLLMEASVQIPVVQDHNGTQPDFGVRPAVGVRLLFF